MDLTNPSPASFQTRFTNSQTFLLSDTTNDSVEGHNQAGFDDHNKENCFGCPHEPRKTREKRRYLLDSFYGCPSMNRDRDACGRVILPPIQILTLLKTVDRQSLHTHQRNAGTMSGAVIISASAPTAGQSPFKSKSASFPDWLVICRDVKDPKAIHGVLPGTVGFADSGK